MADDYGLALQQALIARLRADAALAALVGGRVWDAPPQDPTYPLIALNDLVVRPLRTDGKAAARVTFSFDAVSQKRARLEACRIGELIKAALDESDLSVVGFAQVQCQWEVTGVDRDQVSKTHIATVAFRAILDG